ncbi:MAG: hypothetical protein U0586_04595 [Candidatus Brocadiaceae bacterium]
MTLDALSETAIAFAMTRTYAYCASLWTGTPSCGFILSLRAKRSNLSLINHSIRIVIITTAPER